MYYWEMQSGKSLKTVWEDKGLYGQEDEGRKRGEEQDLEKGSGDGHCWAREFQGMGRVVK